MLLSHYDYLDYEIPNNWCAEESNENLLIYNPNGNGAMTLSFFTTLELRETLDEHISIMAKKFIDQNKITLNTPLIIRDVKDHKKTLCGIGTTTDGWFFKLWIIAKQPKIVFATYQSEQKSSEIKKCDAIIDSIKFTL
ncbi:MAG: hypothetical protein ACI4IK_03865 [Eubacterium sp.]